MTIFARRWVWEMMRALSVVWVKPRKVIESRIVYCVAAVAWLLLLQMGFAAIINVPADHATIQAAINAASDGDEIIVSPGTYYENIHFLGKNIILRSTAPTSPTIVASTIIDGSGAGSVVTFSGTEPSVCFLSGFTITNGSATYGGGIRGNGTAATVEYNIVAHNGVSDSGRVGSTIEAFGGGIYDCDGAIRNNTVSHNTAHAYSVFIWPPWYSYYYQIYGMGAGLYGCDGAIHDNAIYSNVADHGGGLNNCVGVIRNNLIYGNSASGYTAIYQSPSWHYSYDGKGGGLSRCDDAIQNNTIYDNSAWASGGGTSRCLGTIRNCIIWANTAPLRAQLDDASATPSYCCIQDWSGGGTGNISADPQLVDPANGDFRLKPTSPCIDAGCFVPGLSYDFEGNPRPYIATMEPRGDGSHFDIGADEYVREAHSHSWFLY
jgi:hypothetical protein